MFSSEAMRCFITCLFLVQRASVWNISTRVYGWPSPRPIKGNSVFFSPIYIFWWYEIIMFVFYNTLRFEIIPYNNTLSLRNLFSHDILWKQFCIVMYRDKRLLVQSLISGYVPLYLFLQFPPPPCSGRHEDNQIVEEGDREGLEDGRHRPGNHQQQQQQQSYFSCESIVITDIFPFIIRPLLTGPEKLTTNVTINLPF